MFFLDSTKEQKFYEFCENSWQFQTINHPYFRRLLNIQQTSMNSDCFLNQNHNRFEHSVGTFLESNEILNLQNFNSNLVSEQDREKVKFMSLCHDLGHGPFSHLFEHQILPQIGIENFNHETYSVQLATKIYDDLKNPSFDIKDMDQILNCGGQNLKNEIFHLVSNKKFGVDADRLDYIQRDSYYSCLSLNVDFLKLKQGLFLTDDFCFDQKNISLGILASCLPQLHDFLDARHFMFENVYLSPRSQSLLLLKADLIVEASSLINLKEKIADVESYFELTDMIIEHIRTVKHKDKKINELYNRIQNNDRYNFICEFSVDKSVLDQVFKSDSKIQNLQLLKKYIFTSKKFNGDLEQILLLDSYSDNFKDVDFDSIMIKDDLKTNNFMLLNEFNQNQSQFQFTKIQQLSFQIYVKENTLVEQVRKYLQSLFFDNDKITYKNFDKISQIVKNLKSKMRIQKR